MANLRIILADDHPFALLGLKSTLERYEGLSVVGQALTPTALIGLLERTRCDVLAVDLSMPELAGDIGDIGDGLGLIRRIRGEWPSLRVVVVTAQTNAAMLRAIAADSSISLLGKADSLEELPRAICDSARYLGRSVSETIARSQRDDGLFVSAPLLSKRQTDILRRLVSGESIAQIAAALGCHRRTVCRQKREAMARLGVTDGPALFSCLRACGKVLLKPEN